MAKRIYLSSSGTIRPVDVLLEKPASVPCSKENWYALGGARRAANRCSVIAALENCS